MIPFGKPFINILIDNNLSLKDYFIIYCYVYNKVYLLRTYKEIDTITMKDVAPLVKAKYIMVRRDAKEVNLDGFKPTAKGIRFIKSMVDSFADAKADNLLLGDDDLNDLALEKYIKEFEEFYEAYPLSTLRSNGAESSLRLQKKLCKEIYIGILKSNKLKHQKMLELLSYYVDNLKKSGKMMYIKTLKNYLRDEVYIDVQEHMKNTNNNNNNNIDYGGKVI
ncbi:MAG: hypothetical protein GOVbin1709_64 [Prokaryotic dsDNA virus sp.]|nr:MAG: hypothetical protein GOVbin1709_64 [Prokaryotic dsDNA virus sp.]|tara:strand:+ start:11919 stop:12581 length:663 start_codon:yes stop_codon:yes gene_type:complete